MNRRNNNDVKLMGSTVIVQNDNVEKAIRTFKKKIMESGKLMDLKEKEFFEKPTTKRRRLKNQQTRRAQKKREAEQLPKKMF
jgi:small subunit ribosomal protein S21